MHHLERFHKSILERRNKNSKNLKVLYIPIHPPNVVLVLFLSLPICIVVKWILDGKFSSQDPKGWLKSKMFLSKIKTSALQSDCQATHAGGAFVNRRPAAKKSEPCWSPAWCTSLPKLSALISLLMFEILSNFSEKSCKRYPVKQRVGLGGWMEKCADVMRLSCNMYCFASSRQPYQCVSPV